MPGPRPPRQQTARRWHFPVIYDCTIPRCHEIVALVTLSAEAENMRKVGPLHAREHGKGLKMGPQWGPLRRRVVWE